MTKQALTEIVAGMAVTSGGATVTVYEPDEFKRSVDSVDTPSRHILASTEGDVHTWTQPSKGRSRVVWVIKDLFLYSTVESGLGWYEVAYNLDAYIDSYVSKLATANQDNTSGFCSVSANVEEATFMPGVHTYVGRSYYGVMVTLRIVQFV